MEDKEPWEIFIVYYEPTMQWESVESSQKDADEKAAKLGNGYKTAEGRMFIQQHERVAD